jgi:hypothetical protein
MKAGLSGTLLDDLNAALGDLDEADMKTVLVGEKLNGYFHLGAWRAIGGNAEGNLIRENPGDFAEEFPGFFGGCGSGHLFRAGPRCGECCLWILPGVIPIMLDTTQRELKGPGEIHDDLADHLAFGVLGGRPLHFHKHDFFLSDTGKKGEINLSLLGTNPDIADGISAGVAEFFDVLPDDFFNFILSHDFRGQCDRPSW